MRQKEEEQHKTEIESIYQKYEKIISSMDDLKKIMELCVDLHDEMNFVNIKYKKWIATKGYDYEGIYYIANFIVNYNHSDAVVELDENAEQRKKKVATLLFDFIDKSKKKKIHIIEPHPDDALGSASGLCYSSGIISTVHTITRVIDERDYVNLTEGWKYQFIKKKLNIIENRKYGFSDLHWNKRVIEPNNNYQELAQQYVMIYSESEKLTKALDSIVEEVSNSNEYIAIPLGIEHPMHIIVSYLCMQSLIKYNFNVDRVILYVDHPYDFQNIGNHCLFLAKDYYERQLSNTLCRCDDKSIDQNQLCDIVAEIYGNKHMGEFDGSFGRTMCSYFIDENAVPKLNPYLSLHVNNILYITAQAKPFLKTGGSGEVAYQYTKAVQSYVNDIRILMPRYNNVNANNTIGEREGETLTFIYENPDKESGNIACEIEKRVYDGITYYLLDMEECFDKENPFHSSDQGKTFAIFCDAILQKALNVIDYSPNILHCNDWQTALIPFLKRTKYHYYRPELKVLYTIHFFGYKGIFSKKNILKQLGISRENCQICISCNDNCSIDKIDLLSEDDKSKLNVPPSQISFMKAGIVFSDAVSTVSQGYAKELQSYPDFTNVKVIGIRNGVNDKMYPFNEETGFVSYHSDNFKEGKRKNKDALQLKLNLNRDFSIPMICMVSRLTAIKGIDDVKNIIKEILSLPVQLVIIGDDDDKKAHPYKNYFEGIQNEYQGKFAYREFKEQLEFEAYAASDILLMPSRCEACGTTQINAMMYGVIPIVTMLSSFEDTVLDYSRRDRKKEPANWDKGIGFYAYKDDCWVLLEVMKKVVDIYINSPNEWEGIVKSCIQTDFGWKNGSLYKYIKLYDYL